jgi:RNA polymerase sigma-70 factor (ECF subfamily)
MTSEATQKETESAISASLVKRIASGDVSAEAEMVSRYGRGLHYLLKRKARDAALAEDLYQDTFRTAIEKLRGDSIGDPERLAGYLCGIANNLVIAHQRKQARRATESDSDLVAAVPDEALVPEALIAREHVASAVHDLLAELDQERDREILRRFYVLEQPKAIVCKELDLDDDLFNGVLHRARRRFRQLVLQHERAHGLRLVE